MNTLKKILVVAVIGLIIFNCDKNSPNEPKGDNQIQISPRAGNWTGKYGSGKYGLSFIVNEQGFITDFTVTTYSYPCGTKTPVEVLYAGPDTADAEGSFNFDTESFTAGDGGFVSVQFSGKFNTDSNASGEFDETIWSLMPLCFGGSNGIRWAASKDCSNKPDLGVSATRFCP